MALLPLVAMALAFTVGCNKQSQHAPDVWAVVNGKEIKRDEVDKYYRTRVNPEGQEPSQEEALSLKLNVLDELIAVDLAQIVVVLAFDDERAGQSVK